MYFQLNNFTGRLTGNTHVQPYFPVGVAPLNKADPPKIIFQDASVKPAKTTVQQYSSSANAMYATLKKKQEIFQKHDGIPVHLKGGPTDKVLFGLTLALCAVGLAESFYTLFVMSFPKRG